MQIDIAPGLLRSAAARLAAPGPQRVADHNLAGPWVKADVLGEQLFVSPRRPTPEAMEPIRNAPYKPLGGLWTSTLVSGGSDWSRTMRDAMVVTGDRRLDADGTLHGWRLRPSRQARVVEIRGPTDLVWLLEHSGDVRTLADDEYVVSLNFEQLARYYDGLHVTRRALSQCWPRLRRWHVESTVWFRWCFDDVRDLGSVST